MDMSTSPGGGLSWDVAQRLVEDARTGKPTRARGTKIWHVHNGWIALRNATFNAWEQGGAPGTAVI